MPGKKLFPKHFKDLRSKMIQNNFLVTTLKIIECILVNKLTINLSTKFRTGQYKIILLNKEYSIMNINEIIMTYQ